MRTHRLAVFALIALGALALAGCYGSNETADTEAPVFLSEDITEGPADVDISVPVDVVIADHDHPVARQEPDGRALDRRTTWSSASGS